MELNDAQEAYIRNGVEYGRVTNVLKDTGILDVRWFNEFAAVRGTYVHTATDLWDRKDLNMATLDKQLVGYLNAWILFRTENPDIEIVDSERKVYSDTFRIGGRLDNICKRRGALGIIDKKAATTLNPAVEIQTAGYEAMYREMTRYKGLIWRMAVQLFPDGTYKAKTLINKSDAAIWMSAVNIYNWRRKRR